MFLEISYCVGCWSTRTFANSYFTNSYLNFIFFFKSTCTVNLWPTRRIYGRLVYNYSVSTRSHFQKNELDTGGALHIRGASERFAALSYATVCFKKAPRSAPRHSLELSFGERFFATYRCIEIKANKNGVLIFQSSVLCQNSS